MLDDRLRSLPDLDAERIARPVMVQRWVDVVFLHWRFEPAVVQRLLPAGVDVDVFDDSAWVGLVPFRMERLGVPGLAPLPFVGTFAEVNVRTYVTAGDRRGVWFFSLDVDRLVPAAVARLAYHLPYCFGRAEHRRMGRRLTSHVERRWPRSARRATTDLVLTTGPRVDPAAPLPRFLTARWGLVAATRRGRLRYAPVDHASWPLHEAQVVRVEDHLVTAAGLPEPCGPPLAMWSPGVDVRVGRPVPARRRDR